MNNHLISLSFLLAPPALLSSAQLRDTQLHLTIISPYPTSSCSSFSFSQLNPVSPDPLLVSWPDAPASNIQATHNNQHYHVSEAVMMAVTVAIHPVTTGTSPLLLNSILPLQLPQHHSIRILMGPVCLLLTIPRAIASPWPRCSNGASRNLAMAMAMARVLPCEHRKAWPHQETTSNCSHSLQLVESLSLSYIFIYHHLIYAPSPLDSTK